MQSVLKFWLLFTTFRFVDRQIAFLSQSFSGNFIIFIPHNNKFAKEWETTLTTGFVFLHYKNYLKGRRIK